MGFQSTTRTKRQGGEYFQISTFAMFGSAAGLTGGPSAVSLLSRDRQAHRHFRGETYAPPPFSELAEEQL